MRLDNVSKVYGHGESATRALVGVSLCMVQRSWMVFVGPSGHGKSTLLHNWWLEQQAGAVWLDGENLAALSATQLALWARKVGFVQPTTAPAALHVQAALWFGGAKAGRSRERALELLRCRAAIRMTERIASWRNAPEDTIVASFILLPRRRSARGRPVVELAGVAQRPAFPVPEAGAVMAQSVCRSGVA